MNVFVCSLLDTGAIGLALESTGNNEKHEGVVKGSVKMQRIFMSVLIFQSNIKPTWRVDDVQYSVSYRFKNNMIYTNSWYHRQNLAAELHHELIICVGT